VDPEQWWAASSTALELVHTAAQVLLDHSVDEAQEQSEAQWRQTGLYAAIIAVILLVAVLASLVMSRSMVRSLGTLRDQALTVARKRLPEALRVLSGDHHNDQVIEVQATTVDSLAEIEQYPRARTQAPEEIAIVGHAVADVVHLLAELLENATEFSPPSTTVQITGHAIRNGTEAVITVEDRGIGMSPQVLASANQRL